MSTIKKPEKHLIVIVGPTAVGKTAFSIELAQKLQIPIISCDSRQIFKEMPIGTAAPTKEELAAAEHHFIGTQSIHDNYSAGSFEKDVLSLLDQLFINHDQVVMVGGSGLYVKAVLEGFDPLPHNIEIRNQLIEQFQKNGIEQLQEKLQKLDPEYYKEVDIHNPQRVMRALEVCLISSKTYSELRTKKIKERNFNSLLIGLEAPREMLIERINKRTELMMESGWIEEAKSLFDHRNLNALNTVGYKELFQHLEGKIDLNEAIELIKVHTRQFAKRQMTWFKREENTAWFDFRDNSNAMEYVISQLNE